MGTASRKLHLIDAFNGTWNDSYASACRYTQNKKLWIFPWLLPHMKLKISLQTVSHPAYSQGLMLQELILSLHVDGK